MRQHVPDLELTVFESDHDDELDERSASGELDVSFVAGDEHGDVATGFEVAPRAHRRRSS